LGLSAHIKRELHRRQEDKRTDELELEGYDRALALIYPRAFVAQSGWQTQHPVNGQPVDEHEDAECKVGQIVPESDFELLQLVPREFVIRQPLGQSLKEGNALTLSASLATNAVSDDVPPCLTSYVSSSLPSHTMATFMAGKLRGMVR
jgi:hypothetical protein